MKTRDAGTVRRGNTGIFLRITPAPCLRVLSLLTALVLTATLRAESVLSSPQFTRGSGIEMTITNFYEDLPPAGFLPLRVEVKNGSRTAHTWRLNTTHSKHGLGAMNGIFSLPVDAESERTFDLLVPLAPDAGQSARYSNLRILVSGPAVSHGVSSAHSSGRGKPPTAFLGMGESLSVTHWGPLKEALEKNGSLSLDGTPLDTGFLPADWRGLAGFGLIIFSESEWRGIPPTQRGALLDWVSQGGRLVVFLAQPIASAEIPRAGTLGSGSVEHWPPGEDFLARTRTALAALPTAPGTDTLESYTWDWSLAAEVGHPRPPQALIFVFVLLFAIIIGPLNFLWFAPAGNRHRLFWTTPLISVTASLLMGLFIVLGEGIGGTGHRFEVRMNLPEQKKTVSWQEQVSRTGVLASSGFVLTEPTLPLPIVPKNQAASPLPGGIGRSYTLDGATWTGDWFRSRTTQAQLLTTISPTRGRLEIGTGPDGSPVAQSAFEEELQDLWYVDAKGASWYAADLKPGEKRPLQAAPYADFTAWWNKVLDPAGAVTRKRADTFYQAGTEGKFFATMASPPFVPTLPSIRWKPSRALLLGEPVTADDTSGSAGPRSRSTPPPQ